MVYTRKSFTDQHILLLVGVIQDLDQLPRNSLSRFGDLAKLCSAVDQAVHLLLVSDILSNSQQVSKSFITNFPHWV